MLDDGVGLPADYAQHGRGFENMDRDARRDWGAVLSSKRGAPWAARP